MRIIQIMSMIQMMNRPRADRLLFILICFAIITPLTRNEIYNYAPCTNNQVLSTKTFACTSCGTNLIPNPYQPIPTNCVCSPGFTTATDNVCTAIPGTCNAYNSYYSMYTIDGSVNASITCQTCAGNAYPNINKTMCIPCPINMVYDQSQGCVCNPASFATYIKTDRGCFGSTLTPSSTSSTYYNQLKYLIPGCATFRDYLSCSQIANLCAYSFGDRSKPQCSFFTEYNLATFLVPDSSSLFTLKAQKAVTLSMTMITYLSTGNYVSQKAFTLTDLFRCGAPSNSDLILSIGSNIQASCSFNFNHLVALIGAKTYKNYIYQLYIKGDNNVSYEVWVTMNGNTPIKRFFLEDAYSSQNKISVCKTATLSLSLGSDGQLTNPTLSLSYVTLSLQNGAGITPASEASQQLTHSILFNYDITSFWAGAIASFIVVSVLAVFHAVGKTYVGYMNRKNPLLFFLNLLHCWSLWMFYYLLCMTGYWFLFTKTTTDIFMLIPQSSGFYAAFYVLVALMGIFRVICVIIDKADKMNTEVFIINWEKGNQFKNSFREIFIVNSLADFFIHRTISIFWMLVVVLFFMTGLQWERNAAETVTTTLTSIYDFNPKNRVYLYFMSCAVFLTVGVIFKILRRLSVLFWPYPFQDFVDYCNVTNISFFFIKKRSPQAYYIHASLPEKTETTYKDINESIRKGIQKNRGIGSELPSSQLLKMYIVYMSKQMEDKFNTMLRKQEDLEHNKHLKYAKQAKKRHGKTGENCREHFVEQLTRYLQIINIDERENDGRTKTALQSICGIPSINLRDQKALKTQSKVLFDDKMELVSQIFPNGNQLQEIHTVIIVYLLFVMVTNSSPVAAFLTYFIDNYVMNGWISYKCRENLERMTRVKQGFMI